MGFFDTKQVQQRKQSLPEVDSCVKQLTALEAEKRELIFQIGQIYVESADEKTVAGTAYEELFSKLKRAKEEITVLEKRKLAVQGLRKCEKCGNVLVLDSAFCNMCGEKLEVLFVPTEQNPRICGRCGTPYDEDTRFCTACGNKLA